MEAQPNNLFIYTMQKADGILKVYPPGKYKIKVRVNSDNASTVDQPFIVDFKGGWNQISIEQV
jgi:hypothetical protein